MKTNDIQFFYLILILPVLFGLTLGAEGIYKVANRQKEGWFSLIMGFTFMAIVIFAYFFWQKI